MHEISRRIERASGFNLTTRFGASMYQTTNYGLSGMVERHMDPWGYESGKALPRDRYELVLTGDYIATFMGWFQETIAGGGTAFDTKNYEGLIEPDEDLVALFQEQQNESDEIKQLREKNQLMVGAIKALAKATCSQARQRQHYKKKENAQTLACC